MTEEKTYTKVCTQCGCEFETVRKKVRVCEECRKFNSTEYCKRQNAQTKKPEVKKPKAKPKGPSLIEYTAIVERYNREHGTKYTYGKFEELVNLGEIKL